MYGTERAAKLSLSEESIESRTSPRFALMLRAAKIIADGREFLCILRDVSASGVRIRLFHSLPAYEKLELELGSGERMGIHLVWQKDDHAGLRFDCETDIKRLIDESNAPFPRRQIRLRIALEAQLQSGGTTESITLRDISQQGASIECNKFLMMNELVRVDIHSLPPIYAKVRWRNTPLYGLIFEQTFKLDDLARAAAPLQLGQSQAAESASTASARSTSATRPG